MRTQSQFRYYQYGSSPSAARRPAPPPPRPKKSRSAWWKVALLFLICGGVGAFAVHTSHVHAEEHAREVAAQQATAEAAVVPKVQSVMAANPEVTFGVSMVDVQTGAMTNVGTQSPFIAASTAKLLTASLYLHEVEQGQARLDTRIAGSSATTWLQQMIVLSDNTAWHNLNDYLTHPALEAYARSLGITDYNVDDNELSPHDIAALLLKLANGTLLDQAGTNRLLGYMQQANYRDEIVAAVPAGYTVYHKIGFLDDYLHDAAIIKAPNGREVVLVVYTNGHGTYDDEARALAFHQITQAVIQGYL